VPDECFFADAPAPGVDGCESAVIDSAVSAVEANALTAMNRRREMRLAIKIPFHDRR
jgi:hypothetical protein